MKLYIAPRAPSPRRVQMFMHEKGITGIELVPVDINAGEHRGAAYRAKNPAGRVPALELQDGRVLSETRAICTWLEGLHPEPNLMGVDFDERAFIEMHDRQAEWYWLLPIANAIRHTHPGLAPLEQPQFADFGRSSSTPAPRASPRCGPGATAWRRARVPASADFGAARARVKDARRFNLETAVDRLPPSGKPREH